MEHSAFGQSEALGHGSGANVLFKAVKFVETHRTEVTVCQIQGSKNSTKASVLEHQGWLRAAAPWHTN